MKNLIMGCLVVMCLSAQVFAMGKKLPQCALSSSTAMTCGEVTDFCGPHLGACTTNGCPDSPSVVGGLFNGDQCISISVPNHKIEKGMARELAGSSQVCVQGTPSHDQTLSVSYACLK